MSKESDLLLILNVTSQDVDFALINLYNGNTKAEQVSVLNNLSSLLKNFGVTLEKKQEILICCFNPKLDSKEGKPTIKKEILS